MANQQLAYHRIHNFISVTRPLYWVLAVAPVIAGYFLGSGSFIISNELVIAIAVYVAIAAAAWAGDDGGGGGTDPKENRRILGLRITGGSGVMANNLISKTQLQVFWLLLATMSIMLSTFINSTFLVFTGVSLLCGVMYSVTPIRLKGRGIAGILLTAIAYGVITLNAGWVVATSSLNLNVLALSALLCISIFGFEIVPHMIDRINDLRNGIKTFVVQVGFKRAKIISALTQPLSFATLILLASFGVMNVQWFLVAVLTALSIVTSLFTITSTARSVSTLQKVRLTSLLVQAAMFFVIVV